MENAIEIRGLTKRFREFSIEDMNLSIPQGYITGFVGRNGAGKSTTIKAILNMIRLDQGQVEVLGKPMIKHETELKNRIGVVLSEDGFNEDVSLKNFADLIAPMYRSWDQKVFAKYLSDFGLPVKEKISSLSKGMRMKYSLAIALSHHADLFIMDEPTAGLDPIVRDEILDVFMELIQDEGKTVLFSTHITSDLDKVADYVVMIDHGKIIFNKAKDDLLDHHVIVKGDKLLLDQELKKKLVGYKVHEYGFEGLAVDREYLRGIQGLTLEKPNVENLMLYYTRRESNDQLA